MAGRIKAEDIALVRERSRIDEIVEQYVTLRNAGGGSRKGLCPFHDEKSPSFNVRPSVGSYHCFGCGAGGDVYRFLMEIEGLSFVEAVERLAAKYGIVLKYEEGIASSGPRKDPQQRQRLLEAHRLAGDFYAAQLSTAVEAQPGRQFVTDRGFDQAAAERFGMGFSPRSGEALAAHLRGKGFSDDELVTGGLCARGNRGLYDRFRGRLMWPIREMTGEVIGFGARRMLDDDRIDAKYLNTSETPLYNKSKVLYGIDLARRSISGASQAVIVEGYTDVMACHEAGVTTAVATCGTAFGEDHARIMRRLMLDHDAFRGEVIFTFDGDEAGRRAALKTFSGDQQFVSQTYVAVEPRGMDPCDLRLADGDAAVRDLIGSRIPLYRFVLDNMLANYDLDRADQRIDAVREAVTLTGSIRDRSKIEELLREISGRVGVDPETVRAAHRRAAAAPAPSKVEVRRPEKSRPEKSRPEKSRPETNRSDSTEEDPSKPAAGPPITQGFGAQQFADEREAFKVIVQHPELARQHREDLDIDDFTHPASQALWQHLGSTRWPEQPDPGWLPAVAERIEDAALRQVLEIAAVEPMRAGGSNAEAVVSSVLARLQVLTLTRRVGEIKSKLQRTNPIDQTEIYNRMFGELIALEQQLRQTRDRSLGIVPS